MPKKVVLPTDLAACHAIIRMQAQQPEEERARAAKAEAERDAALQLAFRKKIERYLADPKQFVLDFGEIKAKLGAWIDEHIDHTTIYQRGDSLMEAMAAINGAAGLKPYYAMDVAPTAEAMAELIFGVAQSLLDAEVVRVVVHETPNCSAAWMP